MEDYKKLNKQPLTFVLAEFRFSPIYEMETFIPKIQEAFRKSYPTPNKRNEQTVQVQSGGISVTNLDSWAFISANRKNAIEINQGRLVYMTTEYSRFEGFAETCRTAIEKFAEIVDPDLISRIGLRYGDSITLDKNEVITDLINPEFDIPKCIDPLGTIAQHSTNTFLKTELGGLVIRSLWVDTNMTCLPDLQGIPISIPTDDKASERMILDFDHFWEANDESIEFDEDVVMDKLSSLHLTSRAAFWKTTTDNAREVKWA